MGAYAASVGTVVAAIILITPAFSQEVAGIRFTWEINLTTLTVVVAAVIGWYVTVVRQGDKVKAHAATISALKVDLATKVETDEINKISGEVQSLGFKFLAVEAQVQNLKDEVYKDYLSVRTFDKIKDELRDDAHQTKQDLMDAINSLSSRIDNLASLRPAK